MLTGNFLIQAVGKWRGGHGQIIELGNREGCGFTMANTYEQTVNPPVVTRVDRPEQPGGV